MGAIQSPWSARARPSTGGLSIKPAKSMVEMYIDMGGSAAVLGAMRAVATLQPNVAIHAIVGACENMTGSNAYRPGDVITIYGARPSRCSTPTPKVGWCSPTPSNTPPSSSPGPSSTSPPSRVHLVGLGPIYGGPSPMTSPWRNASAAAKTADERFWRLPRPEARETLKSKRADVTNLGGPWGGAITAALFLQRFKGDTPGPTGYRRRRAGQQRRWVYPYRRDRFGIMTSVHLLESMAD